nr:uncharacterized protein C1orf115-like [Saimiri boliviensis boliviensis]
MTVGARLRSKAESSLLRRGPRGRGRTEGDEEVATILGHLESGEEAEAAARESGVSVAGARRVHLAPLPDRYEPLEEPAPGEKPRRRYRWQLKKCGKNVGRVLMKGGCYAVIGLQGFAAAYSAPFGAATSVDPPCANGIPCCGNRVNLEHLRLERTQPTWKRKHAFLC